MDGQSPGKAHAPPAPIDEAGRQAVLDALQVLDTPADDAIDALTAVVREHLGVSHALVTLVDRQRQWFKSVAGEPVGSETARDTSFCGWAILHTDAMVVPDTLADPRFAANPWVVGPPRVRFYAGVPLHIDGRAVGTLCALHTAPRPLDVGDLRLMQSCARVAVRLLRSVERDEALHAHRDAVTGLANRELLEERFPSVCRRAEQRAGLVGVMVIDLDGFGSINETHGRAAGDAVLQYVAQSLRRGVRRHDTVARLDGDEFVVLFDGILDQPQAQAMYARVLQTVAGGTCPVIGTPVRFSAGLALAEGGHADLDELMLAADASLYRDKLARG